MPEQSTINAKSGAQRQSLIGTSIIQKSSNKFYRHHLEETHRRKREEDIYHTMMS